MEAVLAEGRLVVEGAIYNSKKVGGPRRGKGFRAWIKRILTRNRRQNPTRKDAQARGRGLLSQTPKRQGTIIIIYRREDLWPLKKDSSLTPRKTLIPNWAEEVLKFVRPLGGIEKRDVTMNLPHARKKKN